jgi:hypothetical protein
MGILQETATQRHSHGRSVSRNFQLPTWLKYFSMLLYTILETYHHSDISQPQITHSTYRHAPSLRHTLVHRRGRYGHCRLRCYVCLHLRRGDLLGAGY